jgi:class 3 adenylate cyclase
MDVERAPAGDDVLARDRVRLDRLTLRFADDRLEGAFRDHFFRSVIGSVRAAFLLGIATWVVWGFFIRQFELEQPDLDVAVRIGVFIPALVVGLVLTFAPFARRIWETEAVLVLLFSGLAWALYSVVIGGVPFDFGYVGTILIMAFGFTLVRLRFLPMLVTGVGLIGLYLVTILVDGQATRVQIQLAMFYLVSFCVLGAIASYTLERFTRLLFLRERQLDVERGRTEGLLLNILPAPIALRLKGRMEDAGASGAAATALAQEFDEVAVLFADLSGFTRRVSDMAPAALIGMLDGLFSEMDRLADRHGLEKIKTIGDAYMAVAGVPEPVDDPAGRALEMALDLVDVLDAMRWPSGERVQARIGIALGPVVAGVVGRRKFAYDVWGDTVNLASRLESTGRAGRILVSEALSERVAGRYDFGPVELLELKGKGPQRVCYVSGRAPVRDASADDERSHPVRAPLASADPAFTGSAG